MDWSTIIAANSRWLKGVLWAHSGDQAAVDELLQEVLWACIKHHQKQPLPVEAIPRWLYQTARRQALQHRRRSGRQQRLLQRFQYENVRNEDSSNPLSWILSDERTLQIRQALARLSPRDADLLLQKYADGCSAADLATRTGLSITAVEGRLFRARERLRAMLASSPILESLP